MIYFTSDTHFGHKNILGYNQRPWKTVEEMEEGLINNWNSVVNPQDEVYHLGDFAFLGSQKFKRIVYSLNGRIYWIRGNHDGSLSRKGETLSRFEWIKDYYPLKVHRTFEVDGQIKQFHQKIILCHFPLLSWDGMAHGSWHLHGHCHGSIDALNRATTRLDVGVDAHGYHPISLNAVEEYMAFRHFLKVDHHG